MNWFFILQINLKTPRVAFGRGYAVPIFPNKGFLGVYVSGFGACMTLFDVSLIHFVVSLLSRLNRSWAWLTNTPMPQPLRVFGCVVKAKLVLSYNW